MITASGSIRLTDEAMPTPSAFTARVGNPGEIACAPLAPLRSACDLEAVREPCKRRSRLDGDRWQQQVLCP